MHNNKSVVHLTLRANSVCRWLSAKVSTTEYREQLEYETERRPSSGTSPKAEREKIAQWVVAQFRAAILPSRIENLHRKIRCKKGVIRGLKKD